jgi:2-polyprenyl-6-hydroxyphenyl methylase/3-demethylubiquinone-9 3-methyltransferase
MNTPYSPPVDRADASETAGLQHAAEVAQGQRFEFGKNWSRFLTILNEDRILEAEKSLKTLLEVSDLRGKRFLDIGSGSGLFSLAARRLGASLHSFDYDPDWRVEEGSALDEEYLNSLGQFDIVYSWGVLHHTGAMWQALENAAPRVAPGGSLFIAIYNDQGSASRLWTAVKKAYNRLPKPLKFLVFWPALLRLWGPRMLRDLVKGHPFAYWRSYGKERGMSPWRDVVDWVGGYPFEVAKPEEIFNFYRGKGFRLTQLITCGGGLGCNQFVFRRETSAAASPDHAAAGRSL